MTKNMQGGAKENFFGGQNQEILPPPQPDLNAEIFTKDATQNPGKGPGQNPTGGHFFSFNEKEGNLQSFQHSRAQNGLQRSPQEIMANDLSSISSNSDNSTNKHPIPHQLPQKNFPSCSGHILSFQGSTRGDSDQKILNFQGENCDGNSLTNDEKALMMPVVQEELDEERKSSIKEYPDALGDLSPGFDDCRDGECLISGSRLESESQGSDDGQISQEREGDSGEDLDDVIERISGCNQKNRDMMLVKQKNSMSSYGQTNYSINSRQYGSGTNSQKMSVNQYQNLLEKMSSSERMNFQFNQEASKQSVNPNPRKESGPKNLPTNVVNIDLRKMIDLKKNQQAYQQDSSQGDREHPDGSSIKLSSQEFDDGPIDPNLQPNHEQNYDAYDSKAEDEDYRVTPVKPEGSQVDLQGLRKSLLNKNVNSAGNRCFPKMGPGKGDSGNNFSCKDLRSLGKGHGNGQVVEKD